jgi:hypothetical protein
VYQSKRDHTRVIVVSQEGLKFVLVNKGIVGEKALYIPVTVLGPNMKFE